MHKPLVDLNTMVAIESLFRHGPRDPWAPQLAGEFADLFIYGDTVRFPLPRFHYGRGHSFRSPIPSLILDLTNRDSTVFHAEDFFTGEQRLLCDEHLGACFQGLAAFAKGNPKTLGGWSAFHNAPWIRDLYAAQFGKPEYLFSMDYLKNSAELKVLSAASAVSERDLLYALDGVLRFPLYGEIAGDNEHYLNHPLRDAFALPTAHEEEATSPRIAVSFKASSAEFVGECRFG